MNRSMLLRKGLIWTAGALGALSVLAAGLAAACSTKVSRRRRHPRRRPGGDIASVAMDMRVPGRNTDII
jgi:hypothetical protein